MSGVFGWLGLEGDGERLQVMTGLVSRLDGGAASTEIGGHFALAAAGLPNTSAIVRLRGSFVALNGHPFWVASGTRESRIEHVGLHLLEAFAARDTDALKDLHGDFAIALIDPHRSRVVLAVDRMNVRSIVYSVRAGMIAFGPTCDVVISQSAARPAVDPQAVYNYLYHHMVPGPSTIFRGITRVPPGHFVDFGPESCAVRPHWQPRFLEHLEQDFTSLKREFRHALGQSVRTYSGSERCGTFLSGGTDSSTIAGILSGIAVRPVPTFSIGFEAEGYDEMQYARIASRHFATAHHEYYVTPSDVVDAIPRIADAYDQPFGNASAVPTHYCARFAGAEGVTRMLGGDGGDELYGGNSRYARQLQFARYDLIPPFVRKRLLEPAVRHLSSDNRFALLRKAQSYLAQASMPMPDRYESYNLLQRLGPAVVLTPDFLAHVDQDTPLRRMRDIYDETNATALVNRMLALDFQLTLADNDLPKVTRMCELAGVDVAFPMLDDAVIDFSLKLAPDQKVRGTRLRPFFKAALEDLLPAEIIAKEKHGFGLPVGVWLQNAGSLRELAGDTLATLRTRRIVRPDFIDRLLTDYLRDHAGYYGTMVWVLMMLELWYQKHVDNWTGHAPRPHNSSESALSNSA